MTQTWHDRTWHDMTYQIARTRNKNSDDGGGWERGTREWGEEVGCMNVSTIIITNRWKHTVYIIQHFTLQNALAIMHAAPAVSLTDGPVFVFPVGGSWIGFELDKASSGLHPAIHLLTISSASSSSDKRDCVWCNISNIAECNKWHVLECDVI